MEKKQRKTPKFTHHKHPESQFPNPIENPDKISLGNGGYRRLPIRYDEVPDEDS